MSVQRERQRAAKGSVGCPLKKLSSLTHYTQLLCCMLCYVCVSFCSVHNAMPSLLSLSLSLTLLFRTLFLHLQDGNFCIWTIVSPLTELIRLLMEG